MSGKDIHRHRRTSVFFGISLLLHLLLLLLPAPPKKIHTVQRFHVQRIPYLERLQPFLAGRPRLPGRRMERLRAPGFSELPDLSFPEIPIARLPAVPLPTPGERLPAPAKPPEFQHPELVMPDLNELAVEAVRKVAEEYEQFARIHRFDPDTTDVDSESRRRARHIVERAIDAMGGRDSLLAIKEMRAKVWIEASEHVTEGRPPQVRWMKPYAYPIATWRYKGWDTFVNKPVPEQAPMDPETPNEGYLSRNPLISKSRYFRLFGHRWLFFPFQARDLREQGEVARWHFIDRFLGEGIVLAYIGAEQFQDQPVEVIRVNDRQYGHYFEAFFSKGTGLLLATREGLTYTEQRRYWQQYQQTPPVWTTVYGRYKPVQGVLTPHRMTRTGPSCPDCKGAARRVNRTVQVTVRLNIAYNGQEPDASTPDLKD